MSAFRRTVIAGFSRTVIAGVRRTVIAALVSVPLLAQTPDRAQTEALARRATERLQALQREADQLASQEQTLLGDLRRLEIDRQIRAEQFHRVDAEVRQVGIELNATTERLGQLEARDLAERPGLRARVVEIYKLGQGRYARLLLGAADLRGIAQAARAVAALAQLDRQRIAEHERTRDELRTTRAQLDTRRQELEKLRTDAEHASAAAARAAQARSDLIGDIDRRRDLNAQLASELQAAQQKLQLTLRDLAAGGPAAEPAALPLRPFRGDLPWPVDLPAGSRSASTVGGRGAAANGMQIPAEEGAAVRAVHDGAVAFASAFAGFGNLVIVDHGSRAFSLYGNLLEIAVKRGAHVEHGQPVGTVGPSPAGPPALYFELRIDGQPVDPLQWLKKR